MPGALLFLCVFLLGLFTFITDPNSGGDWDPLLWPGLLFVALAGLTQVAYHVARCGASVLTVLRGLGYALLSAGLTLVGSLFAMLIWLAVIGPIGN